MSNVAALVSASQLTLWSRDSILLSTSRPVTLVSTAVGDTVGDTVVNRVGETVGPTVGDPLGEVVGDPLGEGVGDSLGENVGLNVGSPAARIGWGGRGDLWEGSTMDRRRRRRLLVKHGESCGGIVEGRLQGFLCHADTLFFPVIPNMHGR
jgi:hypothetical protein